MAKDELQAFVESLGALHKSQVLHDDLHPGNFIIVKEETKYKAFIIDFGRSKVVKDNLLLVDEMKRFMRLTTKHEHDDLNDS